MKKISMKIDFVKKMVVFCLALIAVRFFKTEHYSFLFLFWNLFLAWLPVFFIKRIKAGQDKYKRFAFLSLSILFLPNAPYILTDLFHLKKNLIAPLWFDLVLILSFAILGLIYFIMSFELILDEIKQTFHKSVNLIAKPLLLLASGYGIYLGRYLRFNSWNVVSDPLHLAGGMFNSVFNLSHLKETLSVTITFTVFLYLIFEIYLSFKNKLTIKQNELH
jgi:uncharacterized membrane protein